MSRPGRTRHHYVSRFYLENFSDPANPPRLWIYDKEAELSGHRDAAARDIAVEKHFYSVPMPDGTRDASLENVLQEFENLAAPVTKKLILREALTAADRDLFATFLAMSMVRVPAYIEGFAKASAATLKEVMRLLALRGDFVSRFGTILSKDGTTPERSALERARQWFIDGTYELEPNRALCLQAMQGVEAYTPFFREMSWSVFVIRGGRYRFVTGDNPLWYENPSGAPDQPLSHGLSAYGIEVTFPLSRDVALVAGWPGPDIEYISASENVVKSVNLRTIKAAQRWIFGPARSDELYKRARAHRGSGRRTHIGSLPAPDHDERRRGRTTVGLTHLRAQIVGPKLRGRIRPPHSDDGADAKIASVLKELQAARARRRASRGNHPRQLPGP